MGEWVGSGWGVGRWLVEVEWVAVLRYAASFFIRWCVFLFFNDDFFSSLYGILL